MRIIAVAAWVVTGWSRLTTVGFAPAEREELRAWWRSGQHELIAAGRARGRAPWAIAAALLWQLVMRSAPHDLGRWLQQVGRPGLRRVVASGRPGIARRWIHCRRLPRAWHEWRDTVLFAIAVYGVGTIVVPLDPLTTLTQALPAPLFWVLWISAAYPWWRLLRVAWLATARLRAPDGEADQAQPREHADPGSPRGTGSAASDVEQGGALRYRRVGAAQRGAPRCRRAADRGPQASSPTLLRSGCSAVSAAGLPLVVVLDRHLTAAASAASVQHHLARRRSPTVRLRRVAPRAETTSWR